MADTRPDMDAVARTVADAQIVLAHSLAALSQFHQEVMKDKERNTEERLELAKERNALRQEREQFEKEAAFVADHNARAQDIVKLSIGGERFVDVARSTLTQVDSSMLAAMFSGRHVLRADDHGRVFLDRSAKYFDFVLDHLRNGCPLPVHLPENQEERHKVLQEFDYFGLPVDSPPAPELVQMVASGAYASKTLPLPGGLSPDVIEALEITMTDTFVAALLDTATAHDEEYKVGVWNLATGAKHLLDCVPTEKAISGLAMRDSTLVFVDMTSGTLHVCNLDFSAVGLYCDRKLEVPNGRHIDSCCTAISETHIALEWLPEIDGAPRICVWDRHTWQTTVVLESDDDAEGSHDDAEGEETGSTSLDLCGDQLLYGRSNSPLVIRSAVSGDIVHKFADLSFPPSSSSGTARFLGSASRIAFIPSAELPTCYILESTHEDGEWATHVVRMDQWPGPSADQAYLLPLTERTLVRYGKSDLQLTDTITGERALLHVANTAGWEIEKMAAHGQRLVVVSGRKNDASPESATPLMAITLYHPA